MMPPTMNVMHPSIMILNTGSRLAPRPRTGKGAQREAGAGSCSACRGGGILLHHVGWTGSGFTEGVAVHGQGRGNRNRKFPRGWADAPTAEGCGAGHTAQGAPGLWTGPV